MPTRTHTRMCTRLSSRLPYGDAGSMLPMIVVCVLIVILMIMAVTASTAAFLAQLNLDSICDGAAAAAASSVDPDRISTAPKSPDFLPVSEQAAQTAVDEYQADLEPKDPTLTMATGVNSEQLTVKCHSVAKIPFGAFFGYSKGVQRDTVSTVRSPLSLRDS